MSSPAEGSGSGTEKPQGFSRFMRRASKALRPRSQRLPNEPIEPATESRTVSVPRPSPSSRPAPPTERSVNDANSYMKLREEKARALFAKYGMTLESTEWTRPTLPTGSSMGQQQPAEWIEKRIVMRVHRQCHRCQTTFSADKICPNCNHTRCKKCPRFPMKRPKDQRPGGEKFDAMAPGALVVDPGYKGKGKLVPLTKPRGEGKADHVRKHPVHRVRRTCHRCDALFVGKATLCTGCGHQRCPTCPRDPYVQSSLLFQQVANVVYPDPSQRNGLQATPATSKRLSR